MSRGNACTQTGCGGVYIDGYCDVCGFPQPAEGTGPAGQSEGVPRRVLLCACPAPASQIGYADR